MDGQDCRVAATQAAASRRTALGQRYGCVRAAARAWTGGLLAEKSWDHNHEHAIGERPMLMVTLIDIENLNYTDKLPNFHLQPNIKTYNFVPALKGLLDNIYYTLD